MAAPTEPTRFGGGSLIAGFTDLTAAFPYGGTRLGTVQAFAVVPFAVNEIVTAEEFGGDIADLIHLRYRIGAAAVLTTWDEDAIARVFLNSSTNGDGVPTVSFPATPGASVGAAGGGNLLYVPDRVTEEPAVVLWDALVDQPAREIKWSHVSERKAVASWIARRNASNQKCDIDLLSRLALL